MTKRLSKKAFYREMKLRDRIERYRDDTHERALTLAKHESDEAAKRLGEALTTYKANANEWLGTFRDFSSTTIPRGEIMAMLSEHKTAINKNTDEINLLMRGESRGAGGSDAMARARQQANWIIGIIVSVGIFATGTIITLIYFLVGKH